MHLVSPNIPDLLLSLWHGTIDWEKDDNFNTWDWAVLQGNTWTAHGKVMPLQHHTYLALIDHLATQLKR